MLPEPSASTPALIGSSPRMRELRQLIDKLGRSDSPVLLLGETGTGKEIAARAIHGVCTAGPFVPIDCSLLGTLLETELFGHTRGAFTGAVADKPGLIELADGGTAFFDEIGEFPLELQAKLLRVLQDKEVRPLGAVARRKARFRAIAATNRDLARAVERNEFRRDLYYRLNVVTVRLPALRDRREDIPELAQHFLDLYGHGHVISGRLMEAFRNYDWPGNVRELENCILRMVAVSVNPELQTADLPSALAGSLLARQNAPVLAVAASAGGGLGRVQRLEDVERQAIREALVFTGGERARAAALLGIGRTTLYRKMKQYRLEA